MTAEATTAPSRVRDRAQYGLCAALALVGLVVIWDATRIGAATSSNDPIGPKALPFVIGAALLVVSALYALDVSGAGSASRRPVRTSSSATPPTGAPSACSPVRSCSTRSSSSGSAG